MVSLLLLLFRVPPPTTLQPPEPAAGLAVADVRDSNAALREATRIHDLAPLFLPTELNAKLKDVPRPEPGRGVFDVEPTRLSFPESGLRLGAALPAVVALNGTPMGTATPLDALLADGADSSLAGFGREKREVVPLPPRGGFLEVVAAGNGERVLAEVLPVEAAPATQKLWQPPQFLALVDPAGLVGPLRLTEGSRVEEVDRHFQDYLMHTYRLGERLGPGFYRITIGP